MSSAAATLPGRGSGPGAGAKVVEAVAGTPSTAADAPLGRAILNAAVFFNDPSSARTTLPLLEKAASPAGIR